VSRFQGRRIVGMVGETEALAVASVGCLGSPAMPGREGDVMAALSGKVVDEV